MIKNQNTPNRREGAENQAQKVIRTGYDRPLWVCEQLLELTPCEVEHPLLPWPILLINSLAKARKTFWALLILIERGFGEDAHILLRALLEQTITLKYIEMAPETRVWDFTDYEVVIEERQLKRFRERETIKSAIDLDAIENLIAGKKDNMRQDGRDPDRFRQNSRLTDKWSGKSIKEMAESAGLGWHYDTVYWISCNLSHTNVKGLNSYVEEKEDRIIISSGPTTKYIPQVLVAGFHLYTEILATFCNALHLDRLKAELDRCVQDAKQAFDTLLPDKLSSPKPGDS